MELNRLLRVLRSRWVIVVLISVVGAVVAFGLTSLANDRLQSVFEGVVVIEFELEGEETVDDLAAEIESERRLAIFATQDTMSEIPGGSIVADTNGARLVFSARGDTGDEARDNVQQLVNAYQNSDPNSGGNITERLDEYERQASEIAEEMESLQPSLSEEELELRNQHQLLDLQIARLQEEIVSLRVADAGATAAEREANENRRAELAQDLEELQAQKAALPPPPAEGLGPVDQLRFDTLQRRLDILEIDYQRLALRTLGVTSGGNAQPPVVSDLTPEPASPFQNGVAGGLGGLGIALLGLVLITKGRKEVWLHADIPMPVLGTVPKRKASDLPGAPWYDTTEGGSRKASVQSLRTAIEGVLDEPSVAMAILGDRVDAREYHTLAVDIAAAFASSGRRVLLVNADFAGPPETSEFDVGEPSVETVLRLPAGSQEGLRKEVSKLLGEAIQIRPDLAVIPSGRSPSSPADALAGPQFRWFIKEAKASFDLIVVVAGSASAPAAQVVAQRMGSALLAIAPGKTTIPSVQSLVRDFNTQRIRPLGSVMISDADFTGIVPRPRWLFRSRWTSPRVKKRVADSPEPVHDPVGRLRFYPTPMEKGSWPTQSGSLPALLGDLLHGKDPHASEADGDQQGPLASELLTALRKSERTDAEQAVEEYLIARVEDVMTAVSGQANLSDELVSIVLEDGYLPLRHVPGRHTVGEWLIDELRFELGAEVGENVAKEFANLLGSEDKRADTLDAWLSEEFFRRHIERMNGAPEVWHLSSEFGHLQILVYARRLNRERLERLTTQVVRRAIDDRQRRMEEAMHSDEFDRADDLERELRDLHQFEVRLGVLRTGSSDEARLHYPWRKHFQQPSGWVPVWSEGIRPNIAPLQALGLLAHPVLTEEEMGSIRSAV